MSKTNVFITALSNIIVGRFEKVNYTYNIASGEKEEISGFFSGEPGIRIAVREMAEKGQLFDKFIFFCTPETLDKKDISSKEPLDIIVSGNGIKFDFTNHKCTPLGEIVTLNSISAFEYIESVIRWEVLKAVKGEKSAEIRSKLGVIDGDDDKSIVNKIDEYVFRACRIDGGMPIVVGDNPDIERIKNIIERNIKRKDDADIYLDITGGTRIASIISLLFSKWYEQNKLAKVKKVLYSSIMNNRECQILDWTNNYELFDIVDPKVNLEDIKVFNSTLTNVLNDEKNEKKNLRLFINQSTNEGVSENEIEDRIVFLQDVKERLQMIESMSAYKLINEVENAIGQYRVRGIAKMLKEATEEEFSEDKDYGKEIVFFNGSIVDYLKRKRIISLKIENIIRLNEGYVKTDDLIKKHEWYYNRKGKKGGVSVIQKVLTILLKLSKNPNGEGPLEIWKEEQMLDKVEWEEPYNNLKGAQGEFNNYFLDKMDEGKVKMSSGINFKFDKREDILLYEKYRNIYFNYGFPFACTGDGDVLFEKTYEYYLNTVDTFFKELQDLYDKPAKDEYNKAINTYIQEEGDDYRQLKEKIKEYDITEYFKVFLGDRIKGKAFISSFKEIYESSRPYRNAVAHPDDKRLAEYRKPEKQKVMYENIRAWLRANKEILSK